MTDAFSKPTPLLNGARSVRVPALLGAVLVPATLLLGGCGSSSDEPVASDTTSASPSATASSSASGSASASASDSASASASTEPSIDPVVAQAVEVALKRGYPALISSGLPAGWSVVGAQFTAPHGGTWTMVLNDDEGNTVNLRQNTLPLDQLLTATFGDKATAADPVNLGVLGTWKSWTARSMAVIGTELPDTSVLIFGSDQAHLKALGQTLLTAEDSDMPDAG